MNTADRSLAMVDYALRRRFSFIDMMPVFNSTFESYMKGKGVDKAVLAKLVESVSLLNDRITKDPLLGEGFVMGHSYFCNVPDGDHMKWYNSIIKNEIVPMLKEYWFDDKDKAIKEGNALML